MNTIPLGKKSEYVDHYDNSLLYPVPRTLAREKMNIDSSIFSGYDEWNCYELSWLNVKGKPEVRILRIIYPYDSEFLVESKSLKLYLNSYNADRFETEGIVLDLIKKDLKVALKTNIEANLYKTAKEAFSYLEIDEKLLIDNLDVKINKYTPDESLVTSTEADTIQEFELFSNLLKSNCPVTGQPDWGTVQIKYKSRKKIEEESLLKYIVSYRNARDFHEVCCEKIFTDIYRKLAPEKLMVKCYYARRGGIDINPVRYIGYTKDDCDFSNHLWRQ